MNFWHLLNPVEWLKSTIKWIRRPNPKFYFEQKLSKNNENEYCHFRINTSANNSPGWFFRLGINNHGKTAIFNSNVLVEKIEVLNSNENMLASSSTSFFLHWANENSDESRNIYSRTAVFLDLLFTIEGETNIFIYHKNKHSGAGINNCLPAGSYMIHLKLLGDNILPRKQKVFVKFNGLINGVEIKLID